MHRQRFLLAALLAAFTASVMAMMLPQPTIAQGAGAATAQRVACTNVNATTTVYDYDVSSALLLMRSDHYNASGQLTYASIGTCGSTLFSGINSAGDWRLELYNQSVRTLYITPNSPINGSQPVGPDPGYYWQKVEAYSKCYDVSGNTVPFQNLTNGSNDCSLGVDFQTTVGTKVTKYKLVMSPKLPASVAATAPATGRASVACNAVSNGQCVNWTITPYANAAAANVNNVADLFYYNQRGALVFVGQYYNTFLINVTNP